MTHPKDVALPSLPRAAVDEHNLQGGRLLYTYDQMHSYAREAILADRAAGRAAAEPEGFVLVPREMHPDQLHDFHYFAKKFGVEEGDAFARAIYAALIAAAPNQESPEKQA